MADILECMMVVCFGISWPLSIIKLWKTRTAKGKSILFSLFVWIGYIFGIISKALSGRTNYVFVFYIINLAAVTIDIILYFRNHRLDKCAESAPTV